MRKIIKPSIAERIRTMHTVRHDLEALSELNNAYYHVHRQFLMVEPASEAEDKTLEAMQLIRQALDILEKVTCSPM